ncbi:bifunctional glutamate N-acetyltransferase/amino-acid acetyltransferase ArgJ [Chloroflexota bacterium]
MVIGDWTHCLVSIWCAIVLMMMAKIGFIPLGSVTSPVGFYAGATFAGIKKKAENVLDLGALFSEVTCVAAGVLTDNRVEAAPIVLCRERLKRGRASAVVINSGCANAFTGEQGLADATEMADLLAKCLGISPLDVLIASTGVIGQRLPMVQIRDGIKHIALVEDGGHELARAIMTTDTLPKEIAITVKIGRARFNIGGVVKGSGMIHPNLATMLCFLTTDAVVDLDFLGLSLRRAVDSAFNMVSIDGDTSTNDMVLIMANGLARNDMIVQDTEMASIFQQALDQVCQYLAISVARDGEGASKLIEVTVSGALTLVEARLAARTVVSSSLVKAAIHGSDPNWGRIVAAVGRSGAEVIASKIDVNIGNICLVKAGEILTFNNRKLAQVLNGNEVAIEVQLHLGTATATAWGCDLSEEYVSLNSQYLT